MNNKEINQLLDELQQRTLFLEEEYELNGGEITESTEQQEDDIRIIQELLQTEGVDSLGRWCKAIEDEIKTLKSEKDAIARRQKNRENTLEYVKYMANQVLTRTGVSKAKGLCYGFTAYNKTTTEVNKDVLKSMYQEMVECALRNQGIIPTDVTITLGASKTRLAEGVELPPYYEVHTSPSCKFTKPRASKDEAQIQ